MPFLCGAALHWNSAEEARRMLDLIYILAAGAFFAALWAFTKACERL